jgi:co-chaperonin GroES (HSP10)
VFLTVDEKKDTWYYRPVDVDMNSTVHDIPFHCGFCKSIKFPFKAPFDYVYIWPLRIPEIPTPGGVIVLPDIARDLVPYGVVLSFGTGWWDKKKKNKFHPTPPEVKVGKKVIYDHSVPWEMPVLGQDRLDHMVKYLTFLDVKAIVEDEANPFILEGVI